MVMHTVMADMTDASPRTTVVEDLRRLGSVPSIVFFKNLYIAEIESHGIHFPEVAYILGRWDGYREHQGPCSPGF